MKPMKYWPLLTAILTIFLSGCGDDDQARVYKIPKESPSEPTAAPMAGPNSMASQTLPPEMVNQGGALPGWSVPDSWTAAGEKPMRKASFVASGAEGNLDISITSFPGDVGGLLANVNRWRSQIGLPATDAGALSSQVEDFESESHPGKLVLLEGTENSTHAAIFLVNGNSWFFKMTGPNATIQQEAEAFRSFIESIDFSHTE